MVKRSRMASNYSYPNPRFACLRVGSFLGKFRRGYQAVVRRRGRGVDVTLPLDEVGVIGRADSMLREPKVVL
jgi:hypothetical protein